MLHKKEVATVIGVQAAGEKRRGHGECWDTWRGQILSGSKPLEIFDHGSGDHFNGAKQRNDLLSHEMLFTGLHDNQKAVMKLSQPPIKTKWIRDVIIRAKTPDITGSKMEYKMFGRWRTAEWRLNDIGPKIALGDSPKVGFHMLSGQQAVPPWTQLSPEMHSRIISDVKGILGEVEKTPSDDSINRVIRVSEIKGEQSYQSWKSTRLKEFFVNLDDSMESLCVWDGCQYLLNVISRASIGVGDGKAQLLRRELIEPVKPDVPK
jgi:hypothetical protein